MDEFQQVMAARADAWRHALTDKNPEVRAFAETHVFGDFGFANRAQSVYLAAGCGDAGIRAVYALLLQADCPLLHAFDSWALYRALAPYFAAEFRATGLFALGWQELAKVTPRFLVMGFSRLMRARVGGFTPRTGPADPGSAKFD
jgi:hypothetical protein